MSLTEAAVSLVPVYGSGLLFAVTFLSCLALPVPSSLMMMAGGAFVASGDLSLWPVSLAAFGGALAGDQAGFAAGRWGGPLLRARFGLTQRRARLLRDAEDRLARHGFVTVFLSRWLFSPLGPYVNLAGGAGGLPWRRFAAGSLAGEGVWVAVYVGLGAAFGRNYAALAGILGNLSGLLAALAVAGLSGAALLRRAAR